MSRRFDRREQIEKSAFAALRASMRRKPFWLPSFIWRPVQALCIKIVFK